MHTLLHRTVFTSAQVCSSEQLEQRTTIDDRPYRQHYYILATGTTVSGTGFTFSSQSSRHGVTGTLDMR